jgi:enamine deaminase RidA (YjgF/YER057c/UK114 family)
MRLLSRSPHGYSQLAIVPAGAQVWISGQVASEPVPDGMEAQARAAFGNVGRALEQAGARWTDVFKLTIFVTDMSALAAVRAVRDEFVDVDAPPTSSLVEVSALVRPDLLIEIEAVASAPPR